MGEQVHGWEKGDGRRKGGDRRGREGQERERGRGIEREQLKGIEKGGHGE
jgi:hypothetical protein